MNIFAVDRSPLLCARALDDKRLRKMLIETAQILCTVINEAAGQQIAPYKSCHVHHPITKWASVNRSRNWNWLLLLGEAYTEECWFRFEAKYQASTVIHWLRRMNDTVKHDEEMDLGEVLEEPLYPTGWHNGARHRGLGIDFTHIADTHLAYRLYLNARWPGDKRKPVWTRRGPPKWAALPK